MPSEQVGRTELDDVAHRLGSPLRMAEPVGWGDARATYRLSLADGRSYGARQFGPGLAAHAQRIGLIMTRLAQAGLPVPTPTFVETSIGPWLLTPWIKGETGASWLGDPARAHVLADRMGGLASRLRNVDLDAIPSDGPRVADPRALDRRAPDTSEETAFVHGDFVPMNVVMGADGEIAALLDFEHAGAGPSLLDIAWWGWVVRHYHPVAWTTAWPTFLAAAGLEPGAIDARVHELVLQTLAGRAAASHDGDERKRWQHHLSTARAWREPGGQPT